MPHKEYITNCKTMKHALALSLVLSVATITNAWTPNLVSLTATKIPQKNRHQRLFVAGNVDKEQREDTTSDAFLIRESNKDWKQPIPYSELTIGVLKETYPGENRVSQTPDSVLGLVKAGFTVLVEAGGTCL